MFSKQEGIHPAPAEPQEEGELEAELLTEQPEGRPSKQGAGASHGLALNAIQGLICLRRTSLVLISSTWCLQIRGLALARNLQNSKECRGKADYLD